MSLGIFQGKQTGPNTFEYFVSYGLSGKNNPSFFTPNLIKANLRDNLGDAKFDLEKHYRRKLEQGNSFKITAMFKESKVNIK